MDRVGAGPAHRESRLQPVIAAPSGCAKEVWFSVLRRLAVTHSPLDLPGVAVGFALLAGGLSQVLAHHLKVPGIVLLLLAGVLLGPDVADVVRPATLADGLHLLVGFAVAVILFEGGLNLDLKRLRRSSRAIRYLVTRGAVITAVAATVLARFTMDFSWSVAALFGCLVIVTGPTVISPLMRRLAVEPNTASLLEGEGVLIDPIGALVAVVALKFVLSPTLDTGFEGLLDLSLGLGAGGLIGVLFGVGLGLVLRHKHLIPEGMHNIVTLASVIALFQGSNAVVHESGLAAVTFAGIALRGMHTPHLEDLIEFKEQLTTLLIGMLFVLLAADVRLADVYGLGMGGVWAVVGMMLVVRPLNVFLGTLGAGLRFRQKLFLSWIGPRGIVSAAVASLVAVEMNRTGLEGGTELRALVFLVIAATVIVAGLTGGRVARALGLARPPANGWLVLGAHALGRCIANILRERGEDVILLDRNAGDCRRAEEQGFRVVYGNALHPRTLLRADLEQRAGAMALTRNDEVNLLFINRCQETLRRGKPALWMAHTGATEGITQKMVNQAGADVLAGAGIDAAMWCHWLDRGHARVVRFVVHEASTGIEIASKTLLPLLVVRDGLHRLVGTRTSYMVGDEVVFLMQIQREAEIRVQLRESGFRPLVVEQAPGVAIHAEATAVVAPTI